MENENLTEFLPQVRCTPAMKNGLEMVARRSVARNISDHIRYAVELYLVEQISRMMDEMEEPREEVPA